VIALHHLDRRRQNYSWIGTPIRKRFRKDTIPRLRLETYGGDRPIPIMIDPPATFTASLKPYRGFEHVKNSIRREELLRQPLIKWVDPEEQKV